MTFVISDLNWFLFFADVRLQLWCWQLMTMMTSELILNLCRCATSTQRPAAMPRLPSRSTTRTTRGAPRHIQVEVQLVINNLRRTFISSTWKAPHSDSQTESRDRVKLLAGLGEAEQVGDQQAQGAEDQERALELAFFNRDMETACGRDQESWQVNDVIFHHHHHHHNPPCHQSAASLTLSASSLLLSASLLMSFFCSSSSLSILRDHAAMAEIYSGNIMVSAINLFLEKNMTLLKLKNGKSDKKMWLWMTFFFRKFEKMENWTRRWNFEQSQVRCTTLHDDITRIYKKCREIGFEIHEEVFFVFILNSSSSSS